MSAVNALAILVLLYVAGCGGRTQLEFVPGNGDARVGGAPPIGETSATGGTVITSGGIGSRTVVATGAGGILAGGASHSGGTTSTGGMVAGGVSPGGGTTADGGDVGVGCSGSFEHIQTVNGQDLCVGKSVWINGPSGSPSYQIDATEVTRGQYESWVATDPALPPSSDPACDWKAAGDNVDASADGRIGYDEAPSCMTAASVCRGVGCDHHPVVCVDWCDAYYYCSAVGKRLCGNIDGGSVAFTWGGSYEDASASQWYRACTAGGTTKYPYGDAYRTGHCNGYDYWNRDSRKWTTLPVATLSTCQSSTPGYGGAYDLSGSVYEWEDSCYVTASGPACLRRGGAFDSSSFSAYAGAYATDLDCGAGSDPREKVRDDIGFRCCSL